MKKIIVLLIIGMFIISGFVSASISKHDDNKKIELNEITFSSKPLIFEEGDYLTIELPGTNTYLDEPGKPYLPIYQKVFEFSRETKIYDVSFEYSTTITESIHSKIIPSIESLPLNTDSSKSKFIRKENTEVYQSNEIYPNNWFDYSIKCGLNDYGKETTFVIVNIYPIRYQPLSNQIHYLTDTTIKIASYEPTSEIGKQNLETYDLLIITPEVFEDLLTPLITHKESIGVKTTYKTVEDILSEYSGIDQPEQIKYFIKDAKENWDISYVLLMGGLKSYLYAEDKEDSNHGSTSGWHVPVRYTNVRHSNEVGVISDLYYSDLYRYNETTSQWEFENWDSNGNGILAEGGVVGKMDELDLIPDLYVGRLACRKKFEVNTVINKIIEYESSSANEKPWYDKMIGIAGRTFNLFDGLDQRQYIDSNYSSISNIEWQEIVPRADILSRIELNIQTLDTSASNLVVSLEKPLGNIIVSSEKSANDIPSETSDWVSFDLQDASTIPFENYYITVQSENINEYSWCYAEPRIPNVSRYLPGNSSLGSNYDWCFRTYDLAEGVEQADGEYSVDAAFRFMEPIINDELRIYWSNEGTNIQT
jgi:hypothetical protein